MSAPGVTMLTILAQLADALRARELSTIVAKVEAVGPAGYVTDLALLENRFEFQKWLRQH